MNNWAEDNFPCNGCQFREDNEKGVCFKKGLCSMWEDYTSECIRRLRLYGLCIPNARCIYFNNDTCLVKEKTRVELCKGLTSDIMNCKL